MSRLSRTSAAAARCCRNHGRAPVAARQDLGDLLRQDGIDASERPQQRLHRLSCTLPARLEICGSGTPSRKPSIRLISTSQCPKRWRRNRGGNPLRKRPEPVQTNRTTSPGRALRYAKRLRARPLTLLGGALPRKAHLCCILMFNPGFLAALANSSVIASHTYRTWNLAGVRLSPLTLPPESWNLYRSERAAKDFRYFRDRTVECRCKALSRTQGEATNAL